VVQNIFALPTTLDPAEEEIIEVLATGDQIKIERILSCGQQSAPGFWYDQQSDEWVLLIQGQAQLVFADGEICTLRNGDTLFIPAHRKHRVEWTSSHPPCIWLAVHSKMRVPE
jgi:cupin 2 domain-containing protein